MDGSDQTHRKGIHEIASDHVRDNFKIRGAAGRSSGSGKHAETCATPETCTICLEPISERAIASPCKHPNFDFLCLISWLQERPTCPLCNAPVTEVHYDWRSPIDWKTYQVPSQAEGEPRQATNESAIQRSRRRRGQDFVRRRVSTSRAEQGAAAPQNEALERRRHIYRNKLFSFHIGVNPISGYRDFSAPDIARSPSLQTRARTFLRRELQVFRFLDSGSAPRGGNREFLLEYIVAVLRTTEVKGADGHAENLVAEYIGREHAKLLLHDLQAWLRSPFDRLDEWDGRVQYSDHAVKQRDGIR